MNIEILLGKTTEHLVPLEGSKFSIHEQMLRDFLLLQKAARADGFDLQIASAFRSYDRQLAIWNSKARGEKVLLDDQERPLEYEKLSEHQIITAILRWSALPGCSRHHWGSDIDIFDGNKQLLNDVRLTPSECIGEGPSAQLHLWLDEKIQSDESFGFFRPYREDLGGVAPERWHLSYYPISRRMVDHYTFSIFKKNIEESEIHFKEIILDNSLEIFEKYFLNFSLP